MTFRSITYSYFLENREFILWRLERTCEQSEYWNTFIKENPHLIIEFEKAIEIFEKVYINKRDFADTDVLYQKIRQSISNNLKTRHRIVYYISTAASIALLIFGIWFYNKESSSNTIATEQIVGKTLPSEDILLFAGGDVIIMNKNSEIELTDGQVTYTDSANYKKTIKTDDVIMNKLIVPNGKHSSLILSDGTAIWINSGTEVKFPSKFDKKTREIYVNGEIYIDVALSINQPFIVHTPACDVEVFGTKFNVSAYDEDDASVVLVEGSVIVNTSDNSIQMYPNEIAKINEENIRKQKIDASLYISWIKGIFIFNNTPISEVLKKIGRYYNISFFGIENLHSQKITGKLYLSENIDDVLSSISLLTSTTYEREDNIIKLINK